MTETIIKIVKQYVEDGKHSITEDTNFKDDLGLDSFDIMNIVIDCEDEFGVVLSDRVIGYFVTVKDIKKAVLNK